MDHQLDYGSSPTGSRNVVSMPNDEDFMGGQDIKRWSATPSQHHLTINADNHRQATPFCWTCYKKRKAGILDADWENRGQKSTGSPTFDISRLVGTIYWHKNTGPYHKVAKTTREQRCGCHQRQDSGMTLGLDWIGWQCALDPCNQKHLLWIGRPLKHTIQPKSLSMTVTQAYLSPFSRYLTLNVFFH